MPPVPASAQKRVVPAFVFFYIASGDRFVQIAVFLCRLSFFVKQAQLFRKKRLDTGGMMGDTINRNYFPAYFQRIIM